jgi:hypothetical protein
LENVLLTHTSEAMLATAAPQLVWVDNDLRYSVREDHARRRLDGSLRQLAFTSRNFISTSEWHQFADRLSDYLSVTDLGRVLAATSVPAFVQTLPSG